MLFKEKKKKALSVFGVIATAMAINLSSVGAAHASKTKHFRCSIIGLSGAPIGGIRAITLTAQMAVRYVRRNNDRKKIHFWHVDSRMIEREATGGAKVVNFERLNKNNYIFTQSGGARYHSPDNIPKRFHRQRVNKTFPSAKSSFRFEIWFDRSNKSDPKCQTNVTLP